MDVEEDAIPRVGNSRTRSVSSTRKSEDPLGACPESNIERGQYTLTGIGDLRLSAKQIPPVGSRDRRRGLATEVMPQKDVTRSSRQYQYGVNSGRLDPHPMC